jgi:iron complex transport system substrate-binding protein
LVFTLYGVVSIQQSGSGKTLFSKTSTLHTHSRASRSLMPSARIAHTLLRIFCHLIVVLTLCSVAAKADINVTDAYGFNVKLEQPAKRIISLAPHTTELLFAAGAGERIVGTVEYSDYPAAALKIPRIGGYLAVDLEHILTLKPDLVVVGFSGNGADLLEQLRGLGLTVYVSEPKNFEDIATTLEDIGTLTGSQQGHEAAQRFRQRLHRLTQQYATSARVSVFYQIWDSPLMTVNGDHLINRVIELCGGHNVFAQLPALNPTISLEAVLARNPDAIIASGMDKERPEWLDNWRHWPQLTAASAQHLFYIPPDLLQRPTPRLLDGAEQLCQALDEVRRSNGGSHEN